MYDRKFERLVAEVASTLMAANSATYRASIDRVLEQLVAEFEVDICFLRRNNHDIGATILVAEWPRRQVIPDPDPLGVIYFRGADPVFAAAEHLDGPWFVRPDPQQTGYADRVVAGGGAGSVSTAAVPLIAGDVTLGTLGFVKNGDLDWSGAELSALAAIATMLVQVHARIEAEESLRRAAYHDALTDLASRRALLEHLDERLGSGMSGSVGVIFLDLDRLKPLNDFLGHAAVDEYLCRTARRLSCECGPDDLVARLGGDEFVVVLAGDVSLGSARERAESLRWAIGLSVQIGGQSVSRGGSLGVAVGEPGRISAVELLRRADEAMMVAKGAGGNSVVAFTEDMLGAGERRNLIELHLRNSIDDDHLTLHYQPIFDLATGVVLGVEALVRWNHPMLGTVQPGEFIGVAESTNLAGELGRWVLHAACMQLARWLFEIPNLSITMNVNVSPVQLVSVDFVESVEGVLESCGVPASSLCLEITEHVVVSDVDPTRAVLCRLEKLGVRCAIDDFGTGYSSLTHLKSLPVDTLKIDRGFVQGLPNYASNRVIVESVMGLASSFGLDVVAEGLETVEAARTLLDLGCRRAQGFLLGKPAPAGEVADLLRAGGIEPQWNRPREGKKP